MTPSFGMRAAYARPKITFCLLFKKVLRTATSYHSKTASSYLQGFLPRRAALAESLSFYRKTLNIFGFDFLARFSLFLLSFFVVSVMVQPVPPGNGGVIQRLESISPPSLYLSFAMAYHNTRRTRYFYFCSAQSTVLYVPQTSNTSTMEFFLFCIVFLYRQQSKTERSSASFWKTSRCRSRTWWRS